jgi:hypothetical protein
VTNNIAYGAGAHAETIGIFKKITPSLKATNINDNHLFVAFSDRALYFILPNDSR